MAKSAKGGKSGNAGVVLRTRNFRLFFTGQALSNIGSFFQVVAQSLLVLELTESGLALGASMSLQFLPVLVLGPFAGVVIDRVRIPKLITCTSAIAGFQAFILGVLTITDHINLGWILGLSSLLGCVQIFDRPAGQALLPQLVSRDVIPNAVSLMAIAQSGGRLGGPALAAVVFETLGPAYCFFFNAISYMAIVTAMALIRKSEMIPHTPQPREKGQLRAGFRFAWNSPLHRAILLSNAFVGMLAFNFPAFYSSLVKLEFGEGAGAFGLAETLNAITAVAGGALLARTNRHPTIRSYALACAFLGTSLAWSAASPTLLIFFIGMPYFGFCVVYYQTTAQSLLQQHTPRAMLGRTMSLFMLGSMGTTPVGGLITGALTDAVSVRASLALGASAPLLCAVVLTMVHGRSGLTDGEPDHAVAAPAPAAPVAAASS